MKKAYAVLNLISVFAAIAYNYFVFFSETNGNTVASLSEKYYNLFTPANYAFAIWGLIYLTLLAMSCYLFKKYIIDASRRDTILRLGPWLIIANICNIAWLYFWLHENTGTSVLVIFIMLFALLLVLIRLGMTILPVPKADKRWVTWPIELYGGWVTVAAVANVAANLAKKNWSGWFGAEIWTLIMIILVAIIYYLVLKSQRAFIFTAVGVWALIALTVRHWDAQPAIQWTAAAAALMLVSNMFVLAGKNK